MRSYSEMLAELDCLELKAQEHGGLDEEMKDLFERTRRRVEKAKAQEQEALTGKT